ncbi:MAG: NAD(P)-binding domain-containing protein [Planctomycetaceae bacterium]|jgi:thioredoxin reductase|nr:NAD(P)-binding domain-containing protein [Planctomycetaceae bacterium]
MAIDTPAHIIIIGAGPIGLETALYARYLGYQVTLIEKGQVCQHVLQWQHISMFSSFGDNSSTLGRAAIAGQSPNHPLDALDQLQTGTQWFKNYLEPLSHTDLIVNHIRTNTKVLSVSRSWHIKTDLADRQSRVADTFRVLIQDGNQETVITADIVIDTSGVLGQPNPIGAGGGTAIGENNCHNQFHRLSPTAEHAATLSNQRILVVGSGHTAAHTLVNLTQTRSTAEATITWITRNSNQLGITTIANDPLSNRRDLVQQANQTPSNKQVTRLAGTIIHRITQQDAGTFEVELHQYHDDENDRKQITLVVDQIFAHTGFQPDNSIFRELQVHLCYATEGPIQLAAKLLDHGSEDCLDQSPMCSTDLINPEPNFYVLGVKSYGRNSNFLFSVGLQQITQLFQIIGDRKDLDLYATFK